MDKCPNCGSTKLRVNDQEEYTEYFCMGCGEIFIVEWPTLQPVGPIHEPVR